VTSGLSCRTETGKSLHILRALQILLLGNSICSHSKKLLRGCRFELTDTINTAVLESLLHLNRDDFWAAVDQLPHQWEKWKELGGDYVDCFLVYSS
jgi:hypothetical protein